MPKGTHALEITPLEISEVKLVSPKLVGDARGFFSETYNRQTFSPLGIEVAFVQDNHSLSTEPGTVRGLHFQSPPFAQDKLVRVVRGKALDVAVDLRRSSPTYGRHVSVILSAENFHQLFVPKGFAHGICTLEPDTEVLYKVSAFYAPEHDKGLLWNDPDLGIEWPVGEGEAVLAEKDRRWPRLKDLSEVFA